MAKFRVTANVPGAGLVQSFVEGARSGEDAKQIFLAARPGAVERAKRLDFTITIDAEEMSDGPTEVPPDIASPAGNGEPVPDPAPAPSDSASAAAVPTSPPANVKDVVGTPSLDELKAFGVSDNDLSFLRAAGMESVTDVVVYAKAHDGLLSVKGAGPEMERRIKAGISALRGR